jgi:asparagine synthetase B (glutamine-hydrolysing)
MCGILFHYKKINNVDENSQFGNDSIFKSLVPVIRERGGDYEKYKTVYNNKIELFSSVLSLRQPLAKQPLIDSQFVIQFNGELYNDEISEGMNDVEYLHKLLLDTNENEMIKIIGHLVGEFAYTITDQFNKKVYYGKDILGRKSLCYSVNDENLYISSCPPPDKEDRSNFVECEKAKIYCYDLENGELTTISFNENIELPTSYQVLNNSVPNDFKEEEFVKELHKQLSISVHKRISTIFPLPQDQTNSKFAILFSGGIDCTLIAGLCGEICEDGTVIDLLNVSFSNPRANLSYDETPDRCLAIKSCKELNDKYNNSNKVKFRLIKINVSYQEYLEAKDRVIKLIYPNDTEMDLSIAIAFYFATNGKNSDGFENSNCKVILSGLGADELFGGYTRHERIFTSISNQVKRKIKNKPVTDTNIYDVSELQVQLRDELQCDLDRLWERNLTRDDKVISCWSKEVRYPFLDEFFVKWVTTDGNVPLTWKLNYNIENGEITRKKALRNLALHMGLDFVALEPKRAIQFGSKSAKMDIGSGKMKGTDKLQ